MNMLEILSYVVVAITVLTMVFGVVAYNLYKLRESIRKKRKVNQNELEDEYEKYLYFEEKELL